MSFLFEQLPLAVQLRDEATFDNFYSGDNSLLLAQLRQQYSVGERYIYIYGAVGSGRSHLLQAACHHASSSGLASVYLPLAELSDYDPAELFEGLHALALVCLDDVHAVLGQPQWEQQLFHLFNRLAEHGTHLLIAADCAVRALDAQLPDLESRLSWGAVFQLKSLNDDQRIEALQLRAARRGLILAEDVARFIMHRCQRDTDTLLTLLDTLDKASLREQRRLTVPFVKATMGW